MVGHGLKSFIYKGPGELMKAQEVLIDIGDHLIDYSNELEEDLEHSYMDTLTILFKRGEFMLSQLGFTKEQKEEIKAKRSQKLDKVVRYKLSISFRY